MRISHDSPASSGYNARMNRTPADSHASDEVWDDIRLTSPHTQPDKARRVQAMFDAIAPTYERVNRLASAGMDRRWREAMVREARVRPDDVLVDVACGTGDVVRTFASSVTPPRCLIGIDFAGQMLARACQRPPLPAVSWVQGDGLRLPVADGSASIVTCAFGIRNFQDLSAGLAEMWRVLTPGGRAVILEFSLPRWPFLRSLYLFYFRRLMPIGATLVSGDRSGAYRYLPESVLSFLSDRAIRSALTSAGFAEVSSTRRTFGIVTVYVARKRTVA